MVRSASAFSLCGSGFSIVLWAIAWIAGASSSTAATFTSFDVPEMTYTAGNSINARGDVVGACGDDEANQGFVRWADGTFTLFGWNTYTESINDDGVVIGTVLGRQGTDSGFVRATDGTISTIRVPGSYKTDLVAINASGVIVGTYVNKQEGGLYGFIRTPDGQFQTFGVPGSEETLVAGINQQGDVAGLYNDAEGLHGYLRTADGTFTTFDPPGSTRTDVRSINDRGFIVGDYVDATGTHGFQRAPDGTMTTFDIPNGASTTVLTFINGRDLIVGWSVTGSALSAFTLTHRGKVGAIRVPKGHDDGVVPAASNINGDITGGYYDAITEHGFIRSP